MSLRRVSMDSEMKHLNLMNIISPSKVPDGWLVEQRPRVSNPNHIDKYYLEPRTGHKFRSLASVQRYLNAETRDYLPTDRMISENKNTLSFKLPEGWLVEHRPRPSNPDHVDRCYIEPHTGQKFRSLVSVKRYLNKETRDYLPTDRVISENKDTTSIKSVTAQNFVSASVFEPRKFPSARDFEGPLIGENACRITPKKKIKTGEDDRGSIHNLTKPPTKVSWVLSSPEGFWNPFLDDYIVPASEKRKWSEAFSISINEFEGATSGVYS
ncbi:methyl-CpG-binding domain-containing protein 7 [Medicago truncatula]|uniref:methyl-CpG-binding domain-containing protein 7 n=1 Tax=Medicago truncatula TaxID=3880 RepID=UPI0019686FAD|nr:methyl-CpG-binding domain-containing protein 7 [Medicago truncatula]